MTFLAPHALWGLLALPMLVAGYVRVEHVRRRRRPGAIERPRSTDPLTGRRRSGPGRHVPAIVFLFAIATLLVGFARPEAEITVPSRTGQVVLAFDTSNSMLAADVSPTRLDLAKQVALDFVDGRPGSVRIGVVAFTNGGLIMQPPTESDADVRSAIERLQPGGGTSIAEGVFASLIALADAEIDLASAGAVDGERLEIGRHADAAIVLLSDGEEITDTDPTAIAELAAAAGVPIHTVAVGTTNGTVVALDGFNIATALDDTLLIDLASATSGRSFIAAGEPDLGVIYDTIDRGLGTRTERVELTALLSLVAIVLVAIGATLSLRWSGRI